MKHLILFFLLFIALPGEILGQWFMRAQNVVPPMTNGNNGNGIYYEHGRIWVEGEAEPGGTPAKTMLSRDSGRSWTQVNLNFPAPGSGGPISFLDSNFGVMMAASVLVSYLTTDGGRNWKEINPWGGHGIVVLSQKIWIGSGGWTRDGGKTTQLLPSSSVFFPVGRDNKGGVYTASGNTFFSSYDSGTTWTKFTVPIDQDSWSLSAYRSCYDSVIYINNEDWLGMYSGLKPSNEQCDIFVSTDGGNSFRSTYTTGKYSIDRLSGTIIAAKHGIAYCATFEGLLRTTDKGQTWQKIGGPGGNLDCTTFALIDDSTIVALDYFGNVWMTTNSGGYDLPKAIPHYPLTQGFTLSNISSCDSGNGKLKVEHIFCSPLVITKAALTSATSQKFSALFPPFPDTVNENKPFLIPVNFYPNKSYGTFNGGVKVHGYYLDEGDSIFIDTTIFFSATSTPVPPNLISSHFYIPFDTLSTCVPPQDTTVTLTNKGCDTLQIISGPGLLSAEFSLLTPLTLPLKLAPDSSITIKFRFKPSGTGLFRTRATFTAEQQTLTQDISINLQGEGEKDVGVLSFAPKKFSFPSISICAHDSASGFVANIGCDSILVDPASILTDPDFRVSGLGLRVSEKPGDTIFYKVYLNPAQKGLRQGYLVLNSNDGIKSHHDTIPFSVTVTDGTKILSTPTTAVDFGKTTLCEEKDSVITLRNTGCDTILVSGVGGLASGFGTNAKFPIIILPGHDTTIDIFTVLDTIGGKTSNSALLTFMSNSDNTLSPISLSRSYIKSRKIDLGLYLDPAVKAGGDLSTVSYDIKESPGKSFVGAGIKLINFNLNYNTDLLDFQKSLGTANLSSSDGKSFTISGSPEITADANGILASIGFRVYLTKDSTTTIDLVNVKIDTTHAPCTTLAFSASGSATFDYQFLCGERSISGFMKGVMPMKIISMRPNPAQDDIEINLESAIKQDAYIEIRNVLGVCVYSGAKNLTSGSNSIHLDTQGLSSGIYVVHIGAASQNFVKVR